MFVWGGLRAIKVYYGVSFIASSIHQNLGLGLREKQWNWKMDGNLFSHFRPENSQDRSVKDCPGLYKATQKRYITHVYVISLRYDPSATKPQGFPSQRELFLS